MSTKRGGGLRSGAAPTAVLWILLFVVMAAVLALFLTSGGVESAGGEDRVAEPPPAAVGSEPDPVLSAPAPTLTGGTAGVVIRPREGQSAPIDPAEVHSGERFQGTGTLRVHVRPGAGVELPERWTLVLRPSTMLIGGERAETRRVERGPDDGLTVVEGLALGGYEVGVEAERVRADPQQVMLAKPTRTDRSVFLDLTPAGYLTGAVADRAGLSVEGIEVVLARADDGYERSVLTDARGAYRFENVPDGDYALHVGGVVNPVVEPTELQFLAPSLTMPLIEVPELGELEFQVVDRAGLVVADASISGWGRHGGRVDVTTDAHGTGLARHLPVGTYSLIVEHEDLGTLRRRVQLEYPERLQVEILLGD